MPKWEDIRDDLFEAIIRVMPPIDKEQQAEIVEILKARCPCRGPTGQLQGIIRGRRKDRGSLVWGSLYESPWVAVLVLGDCLFWESLYGELCMEWLHGCPRLPGRTDEGGDVDLHQHGEIDDGWAEYLPTSVGMLRIPVGNVCRRGKGKGKGKGRGKGKGERGKGKGERGKGKGERG
jgi:hypothetical protein